MKYVANVYEARYDYAPMDWNNKTFSTRSIIHEVYDDLKDAKQAAWKAVKKLWDKYDICREWMIIDSPIFEKCIVTTQMEYNWHRARYFEAEVHVEEDEN